jgi:sterol desaturase/sphingolipid hydroxylase (fatty acid hydroxylase superfamily)
MSKSSDHPMTAVDAPSAPLSDRAKWRHAVLRGLMRLSATRTNSRIGLVIDMLLGVALLGIGIDRSDLRPALALLTILSGLIVFSFVEYGFHRWLFHGPVRAMALGHREHHRVPLGYDALPFFFAPLILLALTMILSALTQSTFALLFAGGLAAGYATYGQSHDLIHRKRFRRLLLVRWAAAHHIHHQHPNKNFGVTSPLWDILLHTRYVSKSVSTTGPRPDRIPVHACTRR